MKSLNPQTPKASGAGHRRPKVLVVDDDAGSRMGLGELLATRYEVVDAGDGEQAVALALRHRPDLILLDVFLPKLNGMHVFERLSEDAHTREIPVIFMSGQGEDLPARCLELGAADFIAKPLAARELFARTERTLKTAWERALLHQMAETDALTGLANFRALQTRFVHEHRRAVRYHHPLSLVVIDLDFLKTLNDKYGHQTGNHAILALATHLRANLRESDFAARFGGDEFVVLLPHQTPEEAVVFVERLRSSLNSQPVISEAGDGLKISISCGVAGHTPKHPKADPDGLLKSADAALYEAKRRGRNRTVVDENNEGAAEAEEEAASHSP